MRRLRGMENMGVWGHGHLNFGSGQLDKSHEFTTGKAELQGILMGAVATLNLIESSVFSTLMLVLGLYFTAVCGLHAFISWLMS